MQRRQLLRGAAVAGAAGIAASSFPAPAISQNLLQWRMVTTWPRGFPGLGTGADLVGRLIGEMSDGRLTVEVYGAGEIVPAFEAMDAVQSGTVEIGHGAPYYWKSKVNASQFIAAIPFGFLAQEQNAWLSHGGGQEVADEVYAEMNTKFFPAGNTGVQMGGWFNREINSLDDYNGLKMRMPGLGGLVIDAAGANVTNLPGGELLGAMQAGTIDAMEWVGPYNDLRFGIHRVAQFYYYPGWHEPGTTLDCFVNLDAYNALPNDLKLIVEHANRVANQHVLNEFVAYNNRDLQILVNEHGVELRKFPDEVLAGLGRLAGEVLVAEMDRDPLSRRVGESILEFRRQAKTWTNLSDVAMSNARELEFPFIEL